MWLYFPCFPLWCRNDLCGLISKAQHCVPWLISTAAPPLTDILGIYENLGKSRRLLQVQRFLTPGEQECPWVPILAQSPTPVVFSLFRHRIHSDVSLWHQSQITGRVEASVMTHWSPGQDHGQDSWVMQHKLSTRMCTVVRNKLSSDLWKNPAYC